MTINLTHEEAQQVLDALEEAQSYTSCETCSPSMTDELRKKEETLRAKLAQPEPKPMAWGVQEGINLHDVFLFKDEAEEMCYLKGDHAKAIPLYTAPPQQQNQFNPDWDAMAVMVEEQQRMAKRIEELESKLKEKNT